MSFGSKKESPAGEFATQRRRPDETINSVHRVLQVDPAGFRVFGFISAIERTDRFIPGIFSSTAQRSLAVPPPLF
jgi:hypothetical protein